MIIENMEIYGTSGKTVRLFLRLGGSEQMD